MDCAKGRSFQNGKVREELYRDREGMVMSERAFPRSAVEACKTFMFQDDDCLIATYPKSGKGKMSLWGGPVFI